MVTIAEDYVSFEIAKLLKENGFDEESYMFYRHTFYNNKIEIESCRTANEDCTLEFGSDTMTNNILSSIFWSKTQEAFVAPTLQMTMKWLREIHKIGIFPSTYTFTNAGGTEEYHPYGTAIINLVTYELMTDDIMPRNSYEQACEAAIKYCLENLI